MNNDFEQARLRAQHSLANLVQIRKAGEWKLPNLAEGILEADTLLSALSCMYDLLLDASEQAGIVGRRTDVSRKAT